MIRYLAVYFSLLLSGLWAERGIIVTLNDSYVERFFLGSLAHLRDKLDCQLPIEVWHDGDELSEKAMKKLKAFSNVTFCDFNEVLQGSHGNLRGWQAKPYMLICTRFDEVCLIDADVYFFDDPEKLFDNGEYLRTGAFFFRDRYNCLPQKNPLCTRKMYLKRRDFFREQVATPSYNVPKAFLHLWDNDQIPTLENPFLADFQEAGCLFLDLKRHEKGIHKIVELTDHRDYVYKCVLGDKETYWLGLEMSGEPYSFNDVIPCMIRSKFGITTMVHFVDGRLFYMQKEPIQMSGGANFEGGGGQPDTYWKRKATHEERKILRKAYSSYLKHHLKG